VSDRPTDDSPDDPPEAALDNARGGHGIFPMRVAVLLTGLTSDTIRAWERRYHAIEPVRSAGNTRKFTHDDIRRLLLLREATEAGHSIGNIADLDEESLRSLRTVTRPAAPTATAPQDAPRAGIDGFFAHLERFDLVAATQWIRRAAALLTPRAFVLEVVAPLLAELRERRADARLGGPHAVVAWQALTASLDVLLSVSSRAASSGIVTVGATRQRHAVAAMATAVLAREHGLDALFLGPAMPDADVLWAVDALGARRLVVDLSAPLSLESAPSSFASLDRLGTRLPVWLLWPAGAAAGADLGHAERVADLDEVDARFAALEGEGDP
jgi:DNA-binding transcriptional MerR regulator